MTKHDIISPNFKTAKGMLVRHMTAVTVAMITVIKKKLDNFGDNNYAL